MSVSSGVNDVLRELNSNQRLRIGVWIILIMAMAYGLLTLSDWENRLETDYKDTALRLIKLTDISNQTSWPGRASAARALTVRLESSLWKTNSAGLAQASAQNWINSQLKKCRISNAKTSIKDTLTLDGYPGIWQVSASIEAPFAPYSFFELLEAIEKEKAIVIEQLDILQTRRNMFTLGFKIYFRGSSL